MIMSQRRSIVSMCLIVALLLIAAFSFTHAASVFDITYPIGELDNCVDRLACKAYCEQEMHEDACTSFAQKYGLRDISQKRAATSGGDEEKLSAILEDGGPGGCGKEASDSVAACHTYCQQTANIEQCVSYGKSHNLFKGEQLHQAEKVAAALKRGAKLPVGCTDSGESCRMACERPASLEQARSCFTFAKEAGLLPPDFNQEQAEKVFSAIERGDAPFASFQEMKQCDRPTDDTMMQKCVDFAVQTGMMDQKQAAVIKKTGGKGPGGCVGKDECDTYCEAHGDECFAFAQEHDLLSEEDKGRMRESGLQMQKALAEAPESVRACIEHALGAELLEGILIGTRMGGPKSGEVTRECFDTHWRSEDARNREESSDAFGEGGSNGSHERGGMPFHDGDRSGYREESAPMPWGAAGMSDSRAPGFPAEIEGCLKNTLAPDIFEKLIKGSAPMGPDVYEKVNACFAGMRRQHEEQFKQDMERQQQWMGQDHSTPPPPREGEEHSPQSTMQPPQDGHEYPPPQSTITMPPPPQSQDMMVPSSESTYREETPPPPPSQESAPAPTYPSEGSRDESTTPPPTEPMSFMDASRRMLAFVLAPFMHEDQ